MYFPENLTALVLDVKCGIATFMKNENEARELAQCLANTANGLGIATTAVLTRMDEPIGMMIGNSVEVIESIECLQGKAPKDLEELICTQGNNPLSYIATYFVRLVCLIPDNFNCEGESTCKRGGGGGEGRGVLIVLTCS